MKLSKFRFVQKLINLTTSTKKFNRPTYDTVIIAGGSFWCLEADFESLPGVVDVVVGYAGGTTAFPTYENYREYGHREVVAVTYDPRCISLMSIWIYAIKHIDPTDAGGSFYDRGYNFSPALYYRNDKEQKQIFSLLAEVEIHGPFDVPLAVQVLPAPVFYPAEDYHQNFYKEFNTAAKYAFYREASGRDTRLATWWQNDFSPTLPWRKNLRRSQVG